MAFLGGLLVMVLVLGFCGWVIWLDERPERPAINKKDYKSTVLALAKAERALYEIAFNTTDVSYSKPRADKALDDICRLVRPEELE